MNSRTTFTFEGDEQIWPIVEKWAKENGFNHREELEGGRFYRRATGLFTHPVGLQLVINEGKVTLQAWLINSFFIRLSLWFVLPAEMTINSGGLLACVPRKMARKTVNKLLEQLGQPLIR